MPRPRSSRGRTPESIRSVSEPPQSRRMRPTARTRRREAIYGKPRRTPRLNLAKTIEIRVHSHLPIHHNGSNVDCCADQKPFHVPQAFICIYSRYIASFVKKQGGAKNPVLDIGPVCPIAFEVLVNWLYCLKLEWLDGNPPILEALCSLLSLSKGLEMAKLQNAVMEAIHEFLRNSILDFEIASFANFYFTHGTNRRLKEMALLKLVMSSSEELDGVHDALVPKLARNVAYVLMKHRGKRFQRLRSLWRKGADFWFDDENVEVDFGNYEERVPDIQEDQEDMEILEDEENSSPSVASPEPPHEPPPPPPSIFMTPLTARTICEIYLARSPENPFVGHFGYPV